MHTSNRAQSLPGATQAICNHSICDRTYRDYAGLLLGRVAEVVHAFGEYEQPHVNV